MTITFEVNDSEANSMAEANGFNGDSKNLESFVTEKFKEIARSVIVSNEIRKSIIRDNSDVIQSIEVAKAALSF